MGEYLPTLGIGCGELAGQSRSVHKSQGAGTPSVPGMQMEYFKLVDGDTLAQSLFDGIDITWGRVGRPDIGDDLKKILDQFDFEHPDASITALLAVRKKIYEVNDMFWRKEKMQEIDKVILECTGLMAELYAKQPQSPRDVDLPFTLHVIARSHVPVTLSGIQWINSDSSTALRLPLDTLLTFEHTIHIPAGASYTQPYWLQYPHMPGADLYTVNVDSLLGMPETPPELNGYLTLKVGGAELSVNVPLSYKKTDPVKGDIVEQLRIVPDAVCSFNNNLLVTGHDGSVQADVRIHTFNNVNNLRLTILGQQSVITAVEHINMRAATDTVIPINIPAKMVTQLGGDFDIRASMMINGQVVNMSQHIIQYSHLPTLQYFTQPSARVLKDDWKCTAKHIGYIDGAGDLIPSFLREGAWM